MSLRRQTLWSMLPILVTSIISIVSVPIYFRVLGDQMYALWFYVGTLTGAFGFMDLGIGVAVGRYIGVALGSNDHQAVKEYWATGNAVVLPVVVVFSLAFIVVGVLYGPTWFKVSEGDAIILQWAMLWGGISLFFSYYGQMWNILAMTYLDFKYLSILRTAFSLGNTVGSLLVALVTQSVAAIVFYTMALAGLQFYMLFRRGVFKYRLPLTFTDFRKTRLLEMLPYTLKTFGQLLSGSLLGSLDRLALGRLAPAIDFAAFNVSLNIGSRLSGLSVAVMQPVFCNTTRGVGGDTSRKPADVYRESFDMMFPWFLLTSMGTLFWAEPVVNLWLGAVNGPVVATAFPWIMAALCITSVSNISGAQLGGLDRVGTGLVFQIVSALGSAVGVIVGWNYGGLSGASIGFFMARVVWLLQDAVVRSIIGIGPSEYLKILPPLIRQLVIVGGIWLGAQLLPHDHLTQAVCALTAALVAGGVEIALFLKPRTPDKRI